MNALHHTSSENMQPWALTGAATRQSAWVLTNANTCPDSLGYCPILIPGESAYGLLPAFAVTFWAIRACAVSCHRSTCDNIHVDHWNSCYASDLLTATVPEYFLANKSATTLSDRKISTSLTCCRSMALAFNSYRLSFYRVAPKTSLTMFHFAFTLYWRLNDP